MTRLALAAAVLLPLGAAAQHAATPAPPAEGKDVHGAARAVLEDAKGQKVGAATFAQTKGGVKLAVKVEGLPAGKHGIHLHAVGKCDAPEFKGAGPHFNPTGKKHGHENPEGFHAGDLPNLEVGEDGKGALEATVENATLGAGEGSLFAGQGTAVVVHASADDGKTDPAGNSGARIACGVVSHGK
jgi:Cu-Zn family superoxide dismutase